MSSRAIRQWFRAQVALRVPSVPYFDTVNVVPLASSLPDRWCTLEFSNSSEQRLSLGQNAIFREYGQVIVIVLGLSGRQDDAVLEAAEMFRGAFTGVRENIPVGAQFGALSIDAPDPPSTDSTESGNWFLASVSCPYTLDVIR